MIVFAQRHLAELPVIDGGGTLLVGRFTGNCPGAVACILPKLHAIALENCRFSLAKIDGPDRNMDMMGNRLLKIGLLFTVFFWGAAGCRPATAGTGESGAGEIVLVRAVMCESIQGYEPQNTAVVFSIDAGKISCFTSFDRIRVTTAALHKWYRRDELITTKRLTLKPPSWSTFSSIQLREADKGPWRVEIWDDDNHLLDTLRFSVAD